MPLSNVTQLNTYEFGNKTDVDAFTTDIDNKLVAALIPSNLTSAAGATAVELGVGGVTCYKFTLPTAGAGHYDLLIPTGRRFEVTGMQVVALATNGSNTNTVKLVNGTGSDDITDAVDMTGKTKGQMMAAALVDPDHSNVASGGTLRLTKAHAGGTSSCLVYVQGILTA